MTDGDMLPVGFNDANIITERETDQKKKKNNEKKKSPTPTRTGFILRLKCVIVSHFDNFGQNDKMRLNEFISTRAHTDTHT